MGEEAGNVRESWLTGTILFVIAAVLMIAAALVEQALRVPPSWGR